MFRQIQVFCSDIQFFCCLLKFETSGASTTTRRRTHSSTESSPSSVRHISIYQSTHDSCLTYKTTAIHHCHGNGLCNKTVQSCAAYQTYQAYQCVLDSFVPLLNHRQIRLSLATSGKSPNHRPKPDEDGGEVMGVMCFGLLSIWIFIPSVCDGQFYLRQPFTS